MITVTCPTCAEVAEIDPAKLAGVSILGCQSCDSEFSFTLAGDTLTFGEEVTEDDDDVEEWCEDCDSPLENCTCEEDDEDDDDETEIADEDEDGDA